jgi:tetratricopeptide (TPR) repeat protein
MDELVGELRIIKDEVTHLGEMLQEIDSMSDILSLDSNEMRFADGCAETLATSVMQQLSAWRINKDQEIANIYEERVKAYDSLVQSQQEEYDNEADMWALHRKQLSHRLEMVLSDSPRGMRSKRDKYGNDPTARLEMTLDEVLEKLESTRIEPPPQMQTTMDDLSAIIDRKRERLGAWKTHCTDVTGTRAKELLAEGQTQVEERRGLLSMHLNRRKAALDFLEKALGERKAVLDEVEGWHRWSYSQLLHFRQVAKQAEDEQKLNDDLEQVTRHMDPGERLPDTSIARTRQTLLDRGNEKIEQLRMQLKDTLASNLNDDPKDAMPGGPLEAEAWLLDGALTMRKELQRDVVEIGRTLTERLATVLAGAQSTLVEEEQGSRSMAISFREAQRRILTEQSGWIEERLRQCMDGSLNHMSQGRRQLEISLARRSADIQDGARALATKCIEEAESNCLCELTNATLRLLMNSNSAQAELALSSGKPDYDGSLSQMWGRRRTGWEDRLDFVRKVLGNLPDNDSGSIVASAAAQVMEDELKRLREKLLAMPGGDLLVTSA